MFFPDEPVPLEAVREIAALLRANGLSEIAFKSKGQDALRFKLERDLVIAAPAPQPVVEDAVQPAEPLASPVEDAPVPLERTEVVAPCVGVFRAPKKPLATGDEVKAKQIVGIVESLRVPNEVVAPFDGRVVELSVVEGQGVEWGQTLLILEPAS